MSTLDVLICPSGVQIRHLFKFQQHIVMHSQLDWLLYDWVQYYNTLLLHNNQ